MTPRRRELLSRYADLAVRYRVYRVPGALEVDETSFVEIHRRRVFFDEVVLVTYHRFRRRLALALAGVIAAGFLLLTAVIAAQGEPAVAAWVGLPGAAVALTVVLLEAVPWHAVTVFGLRTKARIVVRFRERRARALFAALCRDVAAAQRPGAPAPPAVEPPPPAVE